jgi:hypothetical protein
MNETKEYPLKRRNVIIIHDRIRDRWTFKRWNHPADFYRTVLCCTLFHTAREAARQSRM